MKDIVLLKYYSGKSVDDNILNTITLSLLVRYEKYGTLPIYLVLELS